MPNKLDSTESYRPASGIEPESVLSGRSAGDIDFGDYFKATPASFKNTALFLNRAVFLKCVFNVF